MDVPDLVLLGLTVPVAALNLAATWALCRTDLARTGQKLLQGAFVWGLPVIGAVIVLSLLRRDRTRVPRIEAGPEVNESVRQALEPAARATNRFAGHSIEAEVLVSGETSAPNAD